MNMPGVIYIFYANVVFSIHSGVTSGSVKMNFARSERTAYNDYLIPAFGRFLKKCYST